MRNNFSIRLVKLPLELKLSSADFQISMRTEYALGEVNDFVSECSAIYLFFRGFNSLRLEEKSQHWRRILEAFLNASVRMVRALFFSDLLEY
jgi:hypothetical protein